MSERTRIVVFRIGDVTGGETAGVVSVDPTLGVVDASPGV